MAQFIFVFYRVCSWCGNSLHCESFPSMKVVYDVLLMVCWLLHSWWICYTVCCVLLFILTHALHLRYSNLSICLRFKSVSINVSIWVAWFYIPHTNHCCHVSFKSLWFVISLMLPHTQRLFNFLPDSLSFLSTSLQITVPKWKILARMRWRIEMPERNTVSSCLPL